MLFHYRELHDGTSIKENGIMDGSKIILLPNVETGLLVNICCCFFHTHTLYFYLLLILHYLDGKTQCFPFKRMHQNKNKMLRFEVELTIES